eukprot:Transcript_15095.p2 GENE.Transcript_15095~~Transcript_15095.p2  ORF type:complete len:178 (+),score=65.67 Transcript_15095:188-721(+)
MVLVLKLFFLAVRQASKPIANSFKEAAHRSDGVLKPLAVGLGRGVDRLQTQVGRLSEGKAPLLKVAPLEEEKALARGAETLSELIIYSVAGVTVGLEYSRQQKEKEQKKADEKAAELARIEANRQNEARQWAEFKALNERIAAMEQRLGALQEAQAQEWERELKARAESGRNKGWFR